jgi:hypothetical protein
VSENVRKFSFRIAEAKLVFEENAQKISKKNFFMETFSIFLEIV